MKYTVFLRVVVLSLMFGQGVADVMGQVRFEDITAQGPWRNGIPADTHGSGVAIADVDGDGDLDIYLGTERGTPDQYYLNDQGAFTEVAASLGIADMGRTRMALWFDYNADDLLDLVLAGDCDRDEQDCPEVQQVRMYRQEPDGTFTVVTQALGLEGLGPSRADQTLGGMAVGDINVDGWPDLVIATRNGTLDVLLNRQAVRFERANALLGISSLEEKYYQPFIADLNQDQLPDIFCNVDFGPNQFWLQNVEGDFFEAAQPARANRAFNEMGIAAGDYDNDGDLDLYATNIERYFGEDVYSVLLRNDFDGEFIFFEEVAKSLGVEAGGWGWGTTFTDADRDGWLDLAATNGWNLGFETIDQSKLWRNDSARVFTDISVYAGFADSLNAAALVAADLDGDGDQELIQTLKGFTTEGQLLRVLDNQSANHHHYLTVRPRMQSGRNRRAIGATVKVWTGGQMQMRILHAGSSFYGQEPAEAFFGLGEAAMVDSLTIIWPTGARSVRYNVTADQVLTLADTDVVHNPARLTGRTQGYAFVLFWADYANNEEGYLLERDTDRRFPNPTQYSLPANSQTYEDRDIQFGQIHYYRIRAVRAGATSGISQVLAMPVILGQNSTPSANAIFPNPVARGSALQIASNPNAASTAALISPSGQSFSVPLQPNGNGGASLFISTQLTPGLYFLRVGSAYCRLVVR